MKAFRSFRLDTVNHCLWRGDDRLSLAPKAFDVLRYLVEHADRLVTQDEILEALWPGTYVNPEVVKKYVLGIRKVLGDQSAKPTFVATFPRRGYQFIAPVCDESPPLAPGLAVNGRKTIVGRENALAQLAAALNKVLQGHRQILFITGEAGIGKTTLIDVFHQTTASISNLRIARGQCVEGFGGKEAYYPILDALGQLLRDANDGPIVQAFSKRAPTWLAQFPSFVKAEQRDALQKEIIGATRERMVREICEALETITSQNPLLLSLEDLHWVDPSTLDFISALARRRGPAKLLLLGTYRPADVIISQSPLKTLKQDLLVHTLCHEIGLERLEEPDVAEYLTLEFVDGRFPAGLANLIYRHSGGNALFMVTIVQDMVKKQLIAQVGGKWELMARLEDVASSVPETLQQLIEVQFEQLATVEQSVLRSASVAGDRFSVWSISATLEIEPGSIENACEALAERQQFIRAAGIHELANGGFSAHYEFRHSLYREVLYRRLSDVTRSKFHQLLGQRLEALCIPCELELATELASHFERGREYEQAIRYLIVGAENAARRFAYRDSIEVLNHALSLKAKLNSNLEADLEIQIFEFMGGAHYALGAMAESTEAYRAAASRAGQAGLRAAQVRALTCAMCALGFFDPDRGLAAMDEAVEASAISGDPSLLARTQILAASCRLVFDTWRQKDADLCASALATLRHRGGADALPYQRMAYAHVLTLQGDYREALDTFEAGIMRMDLGSNLIEHFISLSGKTFALLRMGRLGEVLRIARATRELAEKNGTASWLSDFREAWLRTLVFDFEGACRICESIGQANDEQFTPQPLTIGHIAAGHIALARREFTRAIEHFHEARDPQVASKFFLHWVWRMTAQLDLANAWLLCGNILRARTEADRFLESALSTADPHLRALAWELQTRLAVAESNWTAARKSIQQALAIVDKFEVLVAAWQAHSTAWLLYRRLKDHKTAATNRERAQTCILRIANSFAPDEPLRASFLAARPIALVLSASAKSAARM
jgi:DNA-binding winged helix-turn-helix (wHTH) protein/tetratricopeptide (TPR) repeat protein